MSIYLLGVSVSFDKPFGSVLLAEALEVLRIPFRPILLVLLGSNMVYGGWLVGWLDGWLVSWLVSVYLAIG